MSNLIVNATDESFDGEINPAGKGVIVDFWAPWCGPCKMIAPHLESLAQERHATMKVIKVNVDECPQVAARFGIRSIPTLMAFKDGEPQETRVGAMSKGDLERWASSQG